MQQTNIQTVSTNNTNNTNEQTNNNQINSPSKLDKQITLKQKRKKTAALKNFLNQNNSKKTQQLIIAPSRKLQLEQAEQVLVDQSVNDQATCKVCFKQIMKKKNCGFCASIACNDHMRKKRKHPKSGKFVRVCDDCQDKHLYQKYMKLELKAQEALQLQQMILSQKHTQISDFLNGKRTKLTMLLNKRKQIQQDRKNNDNRLAGNQNQVRNKQRKLESKFIQLDKLQKQITQYQRNLPRSLQQDYKALTEENEKITKQLVKYQKMCQQALKSKSKKEKEMYQEYYKWQEKQIQKINSKQKKEDCLIY